jgi:hypothetical protein
MHSDYRNLNIQVILRCSHIYCISLYFRIFSSERFTRSMVNQRQNLHIVVTVTVRIEVGYDVQCAQARMFNADFEPVTVRHKTTTTKDKLPKIPRKKYSKY